MKKILIIDNYDSFVYNIYQCVSSPDVHVDVRENNNLKDIEQYDGYIISPGLEQEKEANLSQRTSI